jgi:hypothetical protein
MYEDYEDEGRFRDDLAEHHAAGAAEARAEEAWESEDDEDSDLPWPNYDPSDNYNY